MFIKKNHNTKTVTSIVVVIIIIRVNYTPLSSKMLELHSPPLLFKIYYKIFHSPPLREA